jgi:hypothetical protein
MHEPLRHSAGYTGLPDSFDSPLFPAAGGDAVRGMPSGFSCNARDPVSERPLCIQPDSRARTRALRSRTHPPLIRWGQEGMGRGYGDRRPGLRALASKPPEREGRGQESALDLLRISNAGPPSAGVHG